MKSRTSEPTANGTGNSVRRVAGRTGVLRSVAILLFVLGFAATFSGQTPAIATVDLTAGWATFGEAVPPGAARTALQVGNLPTQTDIKNRWPDGSIRFAIVTAKVPAAGRYAVTAAAPAAGEFMPTVPRASATLILEGVTYTATLPSGPASDRWLAGPLVAESRAVVAPVTAGGTAHDFLRVNFDTRVYRDGDARVDVSVENLLDKVGATTVTYDAAIVVNDQVRFAQQAVQHFYLTRWRQVFALGATPLAAVTPDLRPFQAARALPPYLALVTNVVSPPTGAAYGILREGALTANMPAPGNRPELAPLPDWTARYLVHKHATQRAVVLANGDLSGSWPVHVREAEDSATRGVGAERLLSLDQRPTVWYDARAAVAVDHLKGTPLPLVDQGATTPGPGQTALIPDNAHQPSLAYVPYLLTGDRYYAEEMAFWANYGLLRTPATDGLRGAAGILAANGAGGYAWALRNLADAAAYYPDASPVRAYLARKVAANLQWLDAYAAAVQTTPNAPGLWPVQGLDGTLGTRPTEQDVLAYAIDRASKHGFAGGLTHRDTIAKTQLQSWSSEATLSRMAAAPGEMTTATGATGLSTPESVSPEARLVLMIGIENGWVGAQAAYDSLSPAPGAPSSSGLLADLAQRAGWALDFASPVESSAADIPTAPLAKAGSAEDAAPPGAGLAAAGETMAAAASGSVVFGASTDHAIVVSYRLDVFANGANPNTATPVASSNLGKPAPDASGDITVDRSTFFNALAPGTYLATVSSIGTVGLGRSAAVTFTRSGVPTATLSVAPSSITTGGAATLTWSTTNATTVSINQGIGTVAVSGTRSVSPAATTTYTLTATNAAGSVTATATVTVTAPGTPTAISISFVGQGVSMGAAESAGVVAKANWNNASGATSSTPLALKNETGAATGATVTWLSNAVWSTPITDQTGNRRMMKGYLTTSSTSTTTVTVAGLTAGAYDVYLYSDGDNGSASRTGSYRISGAGITTTTINMTDAGGTNFDATFTQGNNSPGNFVKFSINASGFTLTATPGTSSDATLRAPVNGIQIVPTVVKTTPPITWVTPASILFGTALSAAQLNATTTVPGTFVYTPPSGTVLPVGIGQTLSVTFTPTDTTRYNVASATVLITVVAATRVVPSVVGQTQTAATAAIVGAGLILGTVTTASSTSVPIGSVISSNPVAGTSVPVGSAVNLVVSTGSPPPPPSTSAISISFVGQGGVSMGPTESAGVVAKANWNNASGAAGSTPLALKNETGAATAATVTWLSNGVWNTPITDQAGNRRMMRGYLTTSSSSSTTVTVAGLQARAYDVYLYVDGDNGSASRTASYRISGAGITTTTVNLTDAGGTNFNATFTQANNSPGNYVKFSINASGFTLTATPGTSSDATLRAPVNGIQIVPTGQ